MASNKVYCPGERSSLQSKIAFVCFGFIYATITLHYQFYFACYTFLYFAKSKITSAVAPMTTTALHQAAIQWQDCGMRTVGVIEELNVKAELHDRST